MSPVREGGRVTRISSTAGTSAKALPMPTRRQPVPTLSQARREGERKWGRGRRGKGRGSRNSIAVAWQARPVRASVRRLRKWYDGREEEGEEEEEEEEEEVRVLAFGDDGWMPVSGQIFKH
jgi:hypothetical protein